MIECTPTEPQQSITLQPPHPNDFHAFGATHPGLVRATNDDAFRIEPSIGLVAVADGVATTDGGGTAAQIVVDTVVESLGATGATGSAAGDGATARRVTALHAALKEAHQRVCEEAKRREQPKMATTVAVLWCTEAHAIVMHIGDSRVYRLRAGALEQLTEDHTLAEAHRRRHGSIPPELGRLYAHVITRAISPLHPEIKVDVRVEPLLAGDIFVLCTDGLTGAISDRTVAAVVGAGEPEAVVPVLIDLANDAGGGDNITVAIARHGRGDCLAGIGLACV